MPYVFLEQCFRTFALPEAGFRRGQTVISSGTCISFLGVRSFLASLVVSPLCKGAICENVGERKVNGLPTGAFPPHVIAMRVLCPYPVRLELG